jgi:radical SAM protein with 4Fe4S-binding SPASM domain
MNQRNVFMVLTEECNQRCRFCYNAGTLTAGGRSMSREDYELALGWVKEHFSPQHTMIRLTGGEPTMHKDIVDFVKLLDSHDFKGILITNGTRFEELYPRLREYSHILGVQLSVEGHTTALHEAITRRKGSFGKLLRAIELAKEEFRMNTNTTLSKLNLPYIYEVFEFLREHGVERASLNYATPTRANQGIVPSFQAISEVYERTEYLADILEMEITTLMHLPMCLSRMGKGCAVGNGDVTIDPELNAYPCPAVCFSDTCMGSIRRADPWMLYASEIYRNISKVHSYLPESCRACGYVDRCKGGCYLFWRHGLMSGYELREENAAKIWKGFSAPGNGRTC